MLPETEYPIRQRKTIADSLASSRDTRKMGHSC